MFLILGCNTANPQHSQPNQQQQVQEESNDVTSLNWYLPSFQAVDHNGKPFTANDMKGKLWLVDLIFTRCNNVCPPMTANMAKIQQELKAQGVEIKIISFSVDPEYDTPQVLTQFAKKYHADLSNWYFVTGYSFEEINKITETAFKSNLTKSKGPTAEVPVMINHPSRFYLIDQNGKVRKFYDGLNPEPKEIARDIQQLQ